MAFSKAKLYDKEEQITSGFAKAFGHPARTKILNQLCKDGPQSVQEIAKSHPLSKASMSKHLGILLTAQLITYKEIFPYVIYNVHKKNLIEAARRLNLFFTDLFKEEKGL